MTNNKFQLDKEFMLRQTQYLSYGQVSVMYNFPLKTQQIEKFILRVRLDIASDY